MLEQWFETKKAFLEYLWKDANDRKLVDRMIHRGEACMKDWMYYLVDKDLVIKELRDKITTLEKENEELNLKLEWMRDYTTDLDSENDVQAIDIEELRKENKSLKEDLDFSNKEYEKMEERLNIFQDAIRNCYLWVTNYKKIKITRPDFKRDVLKLEEDVKWEDNQ